MRQIKHGISLKVIYSTKNGISLLFYMLNVNKAKCIGFEYNIMLSIQIYYIKFNYAYQ